MVFAKKGKGKYTTYKKGGKKARRASKKTYPDSLNIVMSGQSSGWSSLTTGNVAAFGNATTQLGAVMVNGSTQNSSFTGAFNFCLSNVPSVAPIATLWDRYRINKIKVTITPEANFAAPGGKDLIPVMKVVRDYDDAQAPVSVGSIWARRGKLFRLDKPRTFTLVPKVVYGGQLAADSTTTNTLSLNQTAPYINTNKRQIPHYGMKFAVKDFTTNTSNNNIVRIDVKYYLTFKQKFDDNVPINISDFNVPLDLPTQVTYIDGNGAVWDNPEFTGDPLLVPDASGNLVTYVP